MPFCLALHIVTISEILQWPIGLILLPRVWKKVLLLKTDNNNVSF